MILTAVICLVAVCLLTQRSEGARPHIHHSLGYLIAAQLNLGLRDTPMRGTGFALVGEGKRWNVHPAFIAAVAGVESSYGAAYCQRYNGWGLGSCPQLWHPPTFRSWRDGISFFARWFRGRWPRSSSPYDVHGYCVDRYGNDCPTWPGKVAYNMRRLGFSAVTRYPS